MNTDKRLVILIFICVVIMLISSIVFVMPRVKESYLSSGQKTVTADIAGRFKVYQEAASDQLSEMAEQPGLKNWETGYKPPELTGSPKSVSYYFSEYFLFDPSGDMVKTTGNIRIPSLKLRGPGLGPDEKGGSPFPDILTDASGRKLPALITPITTESGALAGWLAGTVRPEVIWTSSAGSAVGQEDIHIYLSDSEGNLAGLSPVLSPEEIGVPAKTLLTDTSRAAAKQVVRGGQSLVSVEIGSGWSVISLRPLSPAIQSFRGEYLKVTLILFVLSGILMAAGALVVTGLIKPLHGFIDTVNTRFNPGQPINLEELDLRIGDLCSSINILESVPIGFMVVDPEGKINFFNREAGDITEQDPAKVIGSPMLKYFPNNYYNYTMECINSQREFLALRNIIKVGSFFKELLLNISPIYNGETVIGAVATFQDVTPQRKMIEVHAAYTLARDLASQKDLDSTVRVIAKAASEMVDIEYTAIFLTDGDGRLLISSSHGIPPLYVEQYNSAPYKVDSQEIRELFRNNQPLLHGDIRNKSNLRILVILPDILSFYSFPVVHEGRLIGLVNLYSSEKNKLSRDKIYLIQTLSGQVNTAITNFYEFQKMRILASMDGLTGLFNKKFFMEALQEELINSARKRSPLSMAILDLDHFKVVNDTYGHQAGDKVLKEVADIMSRSLRDNDSICRFGGEEIAVAMPGTSKTAALELIDRIRTKIEETAVYQHEEGPLYITISGGVASYPDDATTIDELILNSDTALYTAKKAGRNKVIGYESTQKLQGQLQG